MIQPRRATRATRGGQAIRAAVAHADAADGPETGRAICLCCIGRRSELPVPVGADHEPAHSLRAIDEGPLRALVIDVDVASLAEAPAAERIQSVPWLAARAERHEAIIAEAADGGPVIPARFGCVFSGEGPLREMLAGHETLLWNALEHVDGASEFALRILVDRERALGAMLEEHARPPAAGAVPRRAESGGRPAADLDVGPWLAERLRASLEPVQSLARAACRHRLDRTRHDHREVVADWAFLVANEDRAAFEAAVEGLAAGLDRIGAEVAAGGPWAPYSFAPSVAPG